MSREMSKDQREQPTELNHLPRLLDDFLLADL